MSGELILHVAGSLVCGMAAGACYFALLYRSVALHATAAALPRVLPLLLLRSGLAVGVFWGLAQLGAWPLIAGLAGFVIARTGAKYLLNRH